jgi:sterol desaturase/sphingolipid hydroxylase (fatty acid hydroxylase superfamily)
LPGALIEVTSRYSLAVNPIVYAIPVFMASILLEAWIAHRRGVATYDIPDAITSLNFGILSQVSAVFVRVFTFGIYVWTFENVRIGTLPTDSVWVWLAALIAYDFIYYWVHRCGHEVNLMWSAHQVHHSSEYFNLSTALRQTSTGAFASFPFYLPMAVLGVPPIVFGTVALIDLLYQYWVHTELVRKLGWLDRIFVTPSNHRVHHGQNDYCIDRNYGGIFIVWDRIFGTFAEERDDEPVVYGIRKPLASYNAVWGNFNVYADVLNKSLNAGSLFNAIRTWFDPPGGRGTALAHLDPATVRRFGTGTSPAMRRYVILQYALLAIFTTYFLAMASSLDLPDRLGSASLIVLSTMSLGWLLEGRRHARAFEVARLLAVTVLAAALALPSL